MNVTIEKAKNGYVVSTSFFNSYVFRTLGEVTQILPDLFDEMESTTNKEESPSHYELRNEMPRDILEDNDL
jgi:hypothetical protein